MYSSYLDKYDENMTGVILDFDTAKVIYQLSFLDEANCS